MKYKGIIKEKGYILLIKLLRILVRMFYIFPIKNNRMLFCSYLGKEYSCNPKYISEYLQANYPEEFEIIWAFRNVNKFKTIYGIKPIQYKSILWIYYALTSKVIIGNNGAVWIPRRKNQLIIDTWHGGGCYKKVSINNENSDEKSRYRLKISSNEINLYLSSSEYFSENVIRKSFMYNGKILESGMPRNDILFQNDKETIVKKVISKYELWNDSYIVLFAPTWRKNKKRSQCLDVSAIKKAIKIRFGKDAVVLGRGHHRESKMIETNIIDVTDYPDMQELLVAADMLITDYSSSIWDYSFSGKPCFLLTPDLEEYSKTPGFDRSIYEWGFDVCCTTIELVNSIEKFDEEVYREKMNLHHKELTSYERGNACKQVCDYINEFRNI